LKINEHFQLIPTLGDVKTIFRPVDAVWTDKYTFLGTIRLSIGIEDMITSKAFFSGVPNQI